MEVNKSKYKSLIFTCIYIKKKKKKIEEETYPDKRYKWTWIESHWKYYMKNYILYIRPTNRIKKNT